MLDARLLRCAVKRERLLHVGRDRLLAIDVLAGGNRALQELRSKLRRRSVEEYGILLVLKTGIQIGRPALDAVLLRERLHLGGVAPDEQRLRHEPGAVL